MAGKLSRLSVRILVGMIFFSPGVFTGNASACTAFVLHSGKGTFLAKNLDWPIGDGLIIINKKGVRKTAYMDQENRMSWVSTYGSVTFNQFGKEFPLGGMNEAGLVIEELNVFGEPSENDSVHQLNEFQWVQYCLDNYSNVKELKAGADGIELKPVLLVLHYLVCDKSGHIAVIEFFQGKIHVYDGDELPYPILSNDLYENLVKYAGNFQGFGGDMPIHRETTAGERFIRVAALLNKHGEWKNDDPVENAFSILDTISQDDTRWSIVYDVEKRNIYFKTWNHEGTRFLELESVDFDEHGPVVCLDIMTAPKGDIEGYFKEFQAQENLKLLREVHRQYILLEPGGKQWEDFSRMARYGNFTGSPDSWKYFGQQPPGSEPEVFAPGIISGKGRIHCFPAISPDLKEVYWMALPPRIYVSEYRDDGWTTPQISPVFHDIPCLRPSFSSDGERIYFASNLAGGYGSLDIWFMEKNDTGFSEPVNIGPLVNTEKFEAQQTFTEDGSIYFTGYVPGKKWDRGILFSTPEGDDYRKPEVLDLTINIMDTNAIDYTPFISQDGSFLLFSSNRHDFSSEECRLYISFKKQASWTEPVNLSGEMGFDRDSRDPYISPDGKYLFFSHGDNIFWVDSGIIEKLSRNP